MFANKLKPRYVIATKWLQLPFFSSFLAYLIPNKCNWKKSLRVRILFVIPSLLGPEMTCHKYKKWKLLTADTSVSMDLILLNHITV